MAALADAFLRLRIDSSQVQRDTTAGINKAASGSDAKTAGTRIGNLLAGGFKSVISVALAAGLTTSIAGAFAVTIKSATEFSSSMEKIHTQAGATQASVTSLSASVLALGGKVQQTPIQLADALYHLKSVGLDDAQAMTALKTASNLAAVGGANLESTTNALAGAWRSGISGAQNFSQAAGTVNAIIGAGNMRMEDFVSAIGTGILPAAKSFGLSLGQVGAGLALMTDEGIPAVDAATRLRMSFSLLGAPSGAAEKQLNKIGLTGLQLAEAMRGPQGLIGAVSLLKEHLDASGLSAAQESQLLSRAFGGGRSSSAILTLLNNLNVLKLKQDQINKSTGAYGPAVAAQQKTAAASFAELRSAVESVGVQIGTFLLPPLAKFAGFLAANIVPGFIQAGRALSTSLGYAKQFYDVFKNSTALLATAAAITAVITAIKLVTLAQVVYAAVSGGVVTAINAVRFAFFALQYTLVTNPIGILVLALIALGAAFVIAWERSSTFRNIVEGAWRAVEAAALTAWNDGIKPAVNGLIAAWGAISAAWGSVASFFTGIANSVVGAFNRIMSFVTSSFDTWWAANGIAIKEIWAEVWGTITAIFKPAWDEVVAVVTLGWHLIEILFTTEWKLIQIAWQTGWNLLVTIARLVWNLIEIDVTTAWKMISAIFTTAWALIQAGWSVFWAVLKAAFVVFWALVEATVKIAWDVIIGLFTVAINLLTGNWGAAWNALRTMFVQVWNAIQAFLKTTLSAIESVLSAAWNAVNSSARAIWNGLQAFFTAWWSGISRTFSVTVSAIGSVLSTAWNSISRSAQAVFNGLKSALGAIWSGIQAVIMAPVRAVVDVVINPFIGGVDTVLSWVGVKGIPKIPGFARGGLIELAGGGRLPGYGGGDRRLILAEDGETVVSKTTSKAMAPLFSAYGVPGYAGGGIIGDIIGSIPGASLIVDAGKFLGSGVSDALSVIEGAASKVASAVGAGNWPSVIGDIAKKVVTAPITKIEDLVKNKIIGPLTSALKSLVSANAGTTRSGVANTSAFAALQSVAAKLGWTGAEWTALNNVEMAEAGYSLTATNPSSGAYGMAQFINGAGEYAQYGGDSVSAAGQATAMANYIAQRYGDPIAAWAHEQAYHWYRTGGKVGPYGGRWNPKVRRYANGGSIPEPVIGLGASGIPYQFHAGEEVASVASVRATADKLDEVVNAIRDLNETTRRVPAGVAAGVGNALGDSARGAAFGSRYPQRGY